MNPRRQLVIFVIALCALDLCASTASAQDDQKALAQLILSADTQERARALEAARLLGPQSTGPELRAALFTALEREGGLRAQRYEAGLRGDPVEPLSDPEFMLNAARVVADLGDPRAVPALAAALGSGHTVTRTLAAFGERAAPSVLAVATSPKTRPTALDHALITLRFMVEGVDEHPLSSGTLEQIRRVAAQRLTGTQDAVTLGRAIDLAVALNDSDLRRIVQAIASDRNEVIARGVTEPDLIERTQTRAADRLAGVPPQPRWR